MEALHLSSPHSLGGPTVGRAVNGTSRNFLQIDGHLHTVNNKQISINVKLGCLGDFGYCLLLTCRFIVRAKRRSSSGNVKFRKGSLLALIAGLRPRPPGLQNLPREPDPGGGLRADPLPGEDNPGGLRGQLDRRGQETQAGVNILVSLSPTSSKIFLPLWLILRDIWPSAG